MSAHSHPASLRTYFIIYGILMVLLVVTVVVAMLHLGRLALPVALSIAFVKAVLIVLYFMHVKDSDKLIKLLAVAGLLWLGILLGLTANDFAFNNSKDFDDAPLPTHVNEPATTLHQQLRVPLDRQSA